MNTKDNLISNIHKLFRKDPYINAVFESVGTEFDRIEKKLILLKKEYLFSTMSLEKIEALEKELAYKTKAKTIEAKRVEIEARWKASGKCDAELLQAVAETWKANAVEIKFKDGVIVVDFFNEMDIEDDITSLRNTLNETKPAHLPLLLTTMSQIQNKIFFGGILQEKSKFDLTNMKEKEDTTQNTGLYIGTMMEVSEKYEL